MHARPSQRFGCGAGDLRSRRVVLATPVVGGGAMELIGSLGCGSMIVEQALAWTGLPHRLTDVAYLEPGPQRARLLSLNPLGHVPTCGAASGPGTCSGPAPAGLERGGGAMSGPVCRSSRAHHLGAQQLKEQRKVGWNAAIPPKPPGEYPGEALCGFRGCGRARPSLAFLALPPHRRYVEPPRHIKAQPWLRTSRQT
jgi:hypothetical protein